MKKKDMFGDNHSDDIELDLDKFAEYIRNLKSGEYVDMDKMVEVCGFTELDKDNKEDGEKSQ